MRFFLQPGLPNQNNNDQTSLEKLKNIELNCFEIFDVSSGASDLHTKEYSVQCLKNYTLDSQIK